MARFWRKVSLALLFLGFLMLTLASVNAEPEQEVEEEEGEESTCQGAFDLYFVLDK